MKILSNERYENIAKNHTTYLYVLGQLYWFSEWKHLKPIWDFVEGKKDVATAREEWRELCAKTLGYSLKEIKNIKEQNERLKIILNNAIPPIYTCKDCGSTEETFRSINKCYKCDSDNIMRHSEINITDSVYTADEK